MKGLRNIGIATLVLGASAFAPIVPESMVLQYSYQYNPNITEGEVAIPASATTSAHVETQAIARNPKFVDEDKNDIISVSAFQDANGNTVEVQIPDDAYAKMGEATDEEAKKGRFANPTKEEYRSIFEAMVSPPEAKAAIAFDQAPAVAVGVTVASLTFAATTAGSNRLLFVGPHVISATNDITGITYNGAALTQIGTGQLSATSGYWSMWYRIAPDTGTNNIVISVSPNRTIAGYAASYTGVAQSGIPDSSNKGTGTGTSYSISTTVVGSTCWLAANFGEDSDTLTMTAPSVKRVNDTTQGFVDSNSIVGTGAQSVAGTTPTSGNWVGVIASFCEPASAGASPSPDGQWFLLF